MTGPPLRYGALACDYDGTLATDGVVPPSTVAALERLRASGGRLLLVTGRELDDLGRVMSRLDLFDRVVAENGALLYNPPMQQATPLGRRPPDSFVDALRERGVAPLSVGRVIVATLTPHEAAVLQTIRDGGLDLEVIRNKGALMVLPRGINKASGLRAALAELDVLPGATVAVGDAENDQDFLGACGLAVAVANALPALKQRADWVTPGARGAGVEQVIARLLDGVDGWLV